MAVLSPERLDDFAERLGYRFTDPALLVSALSHASLQQKHGDYERLEFLGDRVLGLVIADHLFRSYPDFKEGELSGRHSPLVRAETCASAAEGIGLQEVILLGVGERAKGLNLNRTVMGDAMEALIAAIYLDGGLEAARRVVLSLWKPFFDNQALAEKDAKTYLQEWALARALPIPVYRIVKREGPDHEPVFIVEVEVKGRPAAQGTAGAKRAAEIDAAHQFLRREGIRG